MIDKEKEPHKCEAVVKAVKRFYEVLSKKEYTSVDERLHDARYITRINIVIITVAVLITIFNLGKFVLMLLGYR